ncbi:hypothetical protein CXZ10_11030 [Pleomorphomonas diazotrophica]|uniref:DUF1499 domain-containing protein n=1 Tax=Pleomorphomonas diazotrophica TaxID=1166257 RepID=A0A1I4UG84_9HYPH|nr:DUF1499 domain-containing protein [Pleomorphomonas diazotrophica]PKR89207.1 hypothetical protein CXZ10_11030 [Pleomorphomonas diazotrophica]SFM88017.1 Protein of unknown function [Pleomorphomonas diazotrophica]
MSPLRFLGLVLAALFGAFLLLVLAFYTYGREASWDAVFGRADLGPYDFSVPSRTGKLNDTLACPADDCQKGIPDIETRRYDLPPATLFALAEQVVRRLPGKVRQVGANPVNTRFRVIVYSPLLRMPSTLSVMVTPARGGGSYLYAYSRSQIGYYDLGRNTANIVGLIAGIDAELAAAKPASASPASPSPTK